MEAEKMEKQAGIQVERPISLMERFLLTRELQGFPHHLSALTTYPLSSLPSTEFLERRIRELQEHYPALYSTVRVRQMRRPKWVVGNQPWDTSLILSDISFDPKWGIEEIMRNEMERFATVDMDQGVYWQILRYVPADGKGTGVGYVALSMSHVLTDGRGMLYLSEALLAKEPPTTYEPAISATLTDKELKAGLRQILPTVWNEILYPGLPKPLRKILPGPQETWPTGDPNHSHKISSAFDADYSYLALTPVLSEKIKAISQSHRTSFHIVIKVAILFALWRVLRPSGGKLWVKGLSPRDERRPEHPRMTGVYPTQSIMSASISDDTSFWRLVNKWSAKLRDPKEPIRCKRNVGTLKYVPDSPKFHSPDPRRVTGWENFWLDMIENPGSRSVEASLELSNITKTRLPPGASDFAWVQPPFPIGAAVQGSLVGHEGGLRLVSCWRDGFCITREEIKRMEEIFLVVLEGLVEGKKERAEELTVA